MIHKCLVHSAKDNCLFVERQTFHVLEVQIAIDNILFQNAADFVGMLPYFAHDGGGISVDSFGLQENEIAKLQFPDQAGTGQQPYNGP